MCLLRFSIYCRATLPSTREHGKLRKILYTYSIFIPGVRLLWDGVSFLEMTVPSKFRDQLCGLCGNINGDPADDFVGKRGGSYVSGQDFGSSWRVGGLRACSILPKDMPEHYQVKVTH